MVFEESSTEVVYTFPVLPLSSMEGRPALLSHTAVWITTKSMSNHHCTLLGWVKSGRLVRRFMRSA